MSTTRSLLAAVALLAALPAAAQTNTSETVIVYDAKKAPQLTVKPGNYDLQMKDFTFPSGLRVIMQTDHSQPIVAVTSYVDEGSVADPIGKEGIAHFVEHLWFRSEHGDLPKVWDVLASLGCNLNASTGADYTNYMSVCPSTSLESLLRLESLRLTDPVRDVTEDMVNVEREVIRNELRMRYENSAFNAFPYLFEKLYPEGYEYRRLGIGTHGSLDNIKLEDIQKFTVDNYKASNTTVMVVGDFNMNEAANLIFENFAPELIAPGLTADHIKRFAQPGIDNPDPDNPAHWTLWPEDPNQPGTPLELLAPAPRIVGKSPEPPMPADTTVTTVEAPVEDTTVFVAWTLPGAYRGMEGTYNVAANRVSQAVASYMYDEPTVIKDPIYGIPSAGCFVWPGKLDSKLICSIEIKDADQGERIADKAIDQVSSIYTGDMEWVTDPAYIAAARQSWSLSKSMGLGGILRSVDLVSSLDGRATRTAEHAHYTGSAAYFSDQMNGIMNIDPDVAKEVVYTYVTRERAVKLVANPLPSNERIKKQAGTDYMGASEGDTRVKDIIAASEITSKVIAETTVAPDTSKIVEKVLPNGLRVVVMPHGEAPLVKATLIYGGGRYTEPSELDSYADTFSTSIWSKFRDNPNWDVNRIAGSWSFGGGDESSSEGIKAASGNLDATLWLLREAQENRTADFEGRKNWYKRQQRIYRRNWKSDSFWSGQLSDSILYPDSILYEPADWDSLTKAMKEWKKPVVEGYLEQKYQPANATLLIVGSVDPAEAHSLAAGYFGTWGPAEGVAAAKIEGIPKLKPAKKGGVYVFDDANNTQTQVSWKCRIEDATPETRAARTMLGDYLNDRAWLILREQSGVTYGAGAYAYSVPGDGAVLSMSSLVQNRAADFTVTTFDNLLGEIERGEIDGDRLKQLTLNKAKTYVLQQQSTDQMTSRLSGPISRGEDWTTLTGWGEQLGAVTPESLTAILGSCRDNRVVTVNGPVEDVGPRLDEAKIAYEVYDWETKRDEAFQRNDPKTWKKMVKARAKKAEEEATAGTDSNDEKSAE